jgi:probable HAF family extracellular repeat protein
MKWKMWLLLVYLFALAPWVGAQTTSQSVSQSTQEDRHKPQLRYRLVDLGTFGGPNSIFANGLDGILNNEGIAVGTANTADHDPFDPNCITPNCFVTHAFATRGRVLVDLGTLPGGTGSQALWISANGFIAGLSQIGEADPAVPTFPQLRAVLWRNREIINLGTLPGGFESVANAVNDYGEAVGFALNDVPDQYSLVGFPTQVRAFLWQRGVMHDIGTLGGPDAIANFINDRGQVSGPSLTAEINPATNFPIVHPFLWQNGKMIDIGSLGGTDSEPSSMNQFGQVAGNSLLAGDAISHPFVWSNGHLRDLGTLGGDTGVANWISDRGDIAGKGDLPGPARQLHDAALWSGGQTIDLGVLPGDSCSNAYFVNLRGQVVGTSENEEHCFMGVGEHAFLWERGGPMVDLNTIIPPYPNLQLTYAVAINDRGEIVGFGVPPGCAVQDYESCGHAYVLYPCDRDDRCVNETAFDVNGQNTVAPWSKDWSVAPQQRTASTFQQAFDTMRHRTQMLRKGGRSD